MDTHSVHEHEARIRALDADWLAAAERRDLEGMLAIYAADAQELLPDLPPIVGSAAIRVFYADLFRQFPRLAFHFAQEEVLVAHSGDLAIARGTYRFTPDANQPERVDSGKFVGVWRWIDGDWRLVLNISNGTASSPD